MLSDLRWPQNVEESRDRVFKLVEQAIEFEAVASIAIVLVRDKTGGWSPTFGRVDLARASDAPVVLADDLGPIRIISERLTAREFIDRLRVATSGGPLMVSGLAVTKHHLAEQWKARRVASNEAYDTSWPATVVTAGKLDEPEPGIYELLEGSHTVQAYEGLIGVIREVSRITSTDLRGDDRRRQLHLVFYDYRGRIASMQRGPTSIEVRVEPPKAPDLRLLAVASTVAGIDSMKVISPSTDVLNVGAGVGRVRLALKMHGEPLDELTDDEHWPLNGSDSPSVADPALSFLSDPNLTRIVRRDLAEIAAAAEARTYKATLLLAGSILEGILVDVLSLNAPVARSFLPQRRIWPDDASLPQLLEIAGDVEMTLDGATTKGILSKTTLQVAAAITSHRDLIHPRAEIRDRIPVDGHSAKAMTVLLDLVIRDLEDAHRGGLLAAYAAM